MSSKDGSSGDARRGLPAGRLPSLKGRQDLTLGGVPKRTFTPTIPVKRERSKVEAPVVTDTDTHNAERKEPVRGARGRDFRGRGRGRGQDNIIQMKSIFEEASREPSRTKSSYSSYSRPKSSHCSDGGDGMKRENGDHSDADNDNEDDSKEWLANLKKDDFIEYDHHLETKDSNMKLVLLSRNDRSGFKTEQDSKVGIKVKNEIISDDEADMGTFANSSITASTDQKCIKSEKFMKKPRVSDVLLKDMELGVENLCLIQLPDVLPGQLVNKPTLQLGRDACGQANKQSRSVETEKENVFSLNNLSEGCIGKLRTRKSGRTQLVIGDVVLDIDVANDIGFLQDLVSINIQDSSSGGEMSVLGHIKHRLICTPDVEAILDLSEEVRR